MASVAIVCGYGGRDDAVLRAYLAEVARHCRARSIDRVIVSGGHGEAGLMAEILAPVMSARIDQEPEALTTLENLERSRPLLEGARHTLLFVDRARSLKARLLASVVLRGFTVEVIIVDRPEPALTYVWQAVSIPLQLMAAFLPPLASLLHRWKANARTSPRR